MKKATKVFIVIFIVFNLIISLTNLNTVVAVSGGITTEGGYKEWDNTGNTKATLGGTDRTVKATSTNSSTAAVSSDLSDFAMILPKLASMIMTSVVKPQYISNVKNVTPSDVETFKTVIETAPENIDEEWVENIFKSFTILGLVLGYYDILLF